eukprot:14569880-Alexandrium_andersonii.AAC.1
MAAFDACVERHRQGKRQQGVASGIIDVKPERSSRFRSARVSARPSTNAASMLATSPPGGRQQRPKLASLAECAPPPAPA